MIDDIAMMSDWRKPFRQSKFLSGIPADAVADARTQNRSNPAGALWASYPDISFCRTTGWSGATC